LTTSLTQDEYLVLQHLLSGKGTEEIATILELPLHVVRTCIHRLITWVLDELEPSQNDPVPSTVGMSDRVSADTENSMASRPFARTRWVRAHTRGVRPRPELCVRSPLQIGAARRPLSRTLGTGILPMTVQVVAIDDGVLVDGELDMDAADDFLRLAEANVDGTHEVVLDIADLGFIDSAGVGCDPPARFDLMPERHSRASATRRRPARPRHREYRGDPRHPRRAARRLDHG
jgi:hypothetical protein